MCVPGCIWCSPPGGGRCRRSATWPAGTRSPGPSRSQGWKIPAHQIPKKKLWNQIKSKAIKVAIKIGNNFIKPEAILKTKTGNREKHCINIHFPF